MAPPSVSRDISRILKFVVAVVAVAALYLAKVVFLPLGMAVLLAFLLSPLVLLMEKIRVPRVLAVLTSILAMFALLCAIGWGVATQLIEIASHLPDYRTNIVTKIEEFHHTGKTTRIIRAEKELSRLGAQLGLTDSENVHRYSRAPLGSSPDRPVQVKESSSTTGTTLGALHGVIRGLVEALLVVVFSFFILLQREELRNRMIRLTGRGDLNAKTRAMDEASQKVSRYFLLLFAVNCSYGAVIFAALRFLGLPQAWLFGALTALLRFIPYVGAPISALLPILVALAVFPGWEQAGIILGIFMFVEILTANYIEPRLYGRHTGVTPIAILVAAVFWTLIWGPIGLLLSVPLTVCLAVVGSHVPSLQFLAVLLGDEPVLEPSVHYYQRLLAGDEGEARKVLENHLTDTSLDTLYDAVVIPALMLVEQDRHRGLLDDTTVDYIDRTTRELVDEMPLRAERNSEAEPAAGEELDTIPAVAAAVGVQPNVLCVPVRDNADELAALMLCQLLERGGHFVRVLPIRKLNRIAAEIARAGKDLVILSALPPFAMSNARGVYRKLRAQQPGLKIVIGLWSYADDQARAAREISRGEQDQLCTTLAQAVAQIGSTPQSVSQATETARDQAAIPRDPSGAAA